MDGRAPITMTEASILIGAYQRALHQGNASIAMAVNRIFNDTTTVLRKAVPSGVTLAMILTVVGHLALKHCVFVFGVGVSGAIIWQRVTGIFAGLVAKAFHDMTNQATRFTLGKLSVAAAQL